MILPILVLLTGTLSAQETLRVNGSTTVNPVVSEAAEILRSAGAMKISVDTVGGSSGGIGALAEGRVEVGMASRPIVEEDKLKYPAADFRPVTIGYDAIALIVSKDIWDAGIRALTQDQVRSIYEGKVTNWKELAGPDRRIAYFNKEPGRGTWEIFAQWLYGDPKKAPLVAHPEVGANEEVVSKVGGSRGAISYVSASWADGKRVFALGIRLEDGSVVEPAMENIASAKYPMTRPLFVITNGAPNKAAQILIDFLTGPKGQELVAKHGYLTLGRTRQQ